MIRSLVILIMAISLLGATHNEGCGFRPGFKIDDQLLSLKDSLLSNDTLIIYRHWPYSNGENGYGKAIIKRNGKHLVKLFEIIRENRELKVTEWEYTLDYRETFTKLRKCLASDDTLLVEPDLRMSHDGMQTMEAHTAKGLVYSYCEYDTWFQANKTNQNIELLLTLHDTSKYSPVVFDYTVSLKVQLKGRHPPDFNPVEQLNYSSEYNVKYFYTYKRLFKKNLKYQWVEGEWVLILK